MISIGAFASVNLKDIKFIIGVKQNNREFNGKKLMQTLKKYF